MRYRLRTLLIVLAVGPMVLAVSWWKYSEWREREHQAAIELKLREVNAALSRWLNAETVSEARRKTEIIRLEERAKVLNRMKAESR